MSATIRDLLAQRGLKAVKISEQHGGEYVSPCPKCGGRERFHIWPLRNPNIMRGGTWWCNCCVRGGGVDSFLQAFGDPQVGTVVGDSVWSFLKSFPVVDFEEASKEKLREIILLQQKYLEIYSDKNVRLTAAKAEALATAEAYEADLESAQAAGIEAMRRAELAETRAEMLSEKLANALKVNAASQMEAAVKLFTGLTAAMTGEEPPADMTVCYCPHCGKQMETVADAALHDAVCEKHPAVIAAVAAECARDWLAEKLADMSNKMNRAVEPVRSFCDACGICDSASEMEGWTCQDAFLEAANKAAESEAKA